MAPPSGSGPTARWTFLTNHSHVLLCLAGDPDVRLRDIATRVGITERAVQRIVAELEEAGYVRRDRDGRRNHYVIDPSLPLRHPIEEHQTIGALIESVLPGATRAATRGASGASRAARGRRRTR